MAEPSSVRRKSGWNSLPTEVIKLIVSRVDNLSTMPLAACSSGLYRLLKALRLELFKPAPCLLMPPNLQKRHVMHFISCRHLHRICIHVCLMHPSIFPVVRFSIRHSYVLRRPLLSLFRERVLNTLGMDRDLPSGLGTPLVDRLSSFVPFGVRLVLQRLTG